MNLVAPDKALPHHNVDAAQLLVDRYIRGTSAMEDWARIAKKAINMTEGMQWDEMAIAALKLQDRKGFTWNEIGNIVRTVIGYFLDTRTDKKVLPAATGSGTDNVAEVLTHLLKILDDINQMKYVDAEVFLDGIVTGRGFYDARLSFEDNDLGELAVTSSDPFSTILDPDGDQYDLNSLNYVIDDRWVSIDEVRAVYGENASLALTPLLSPTASGMPVGSLDWVRISAPWRYFGGQKENVGWRSLESYYLQAIDPARKNVRLLDCQHAVHTMRKYWIDLDTGRKEPVDEAWTEEQIQRVLAWSKDVYARKGKQSPIMVVRRPGKRIRWTTMVGDIIVFDKWSPYESITKVGYFPWFRRGKTRGMVEDMIEPQEAVNKAGSSEIDIIARSANTGWKYKDTSLTAEQERDLKLYGARPGFNLKYHGTEAPTRIEPGMQPTALRDLGMRNSDKLKVVSGLNDSALGQLDRVQSGVAVQARQQQSIIAIQCYIDNMSRSKNLLGKKEVELIQNHYTEERLYRVLGDDGKQLEVAVNQRAASGEIVNDLVNGKYTLIIDETPLSKSFKSAQLTEAMDYVEKGIIPVTPETRNLLIDMSSMPNKALFKAALQKSMEDAAKNPISPRLMESINYKDAPEDIRRQMEAQAGFQPSQIGAVAPPGAAPAQAAPDGTPLPPPPA